MQQKKTAESKDNHIFLVVKDKKTALTESDFYTKKNRIHFSQQEQLRLSTRLIK